MSAHTPGRGLILKAGMTEAYFMALHKHNSAIRKFEQAKQAYRAKRINDETFLAAKTAYDQATAEYDAAYAKEQGITQVKEKTK